jgi:hypothetical protein
MDDDMTSNLARLLTRTEDSIGVLSGCCPNRAWWVAAVKRGRKRQP